MLNNKLTRTTISIPENLLFEMKKEALMEKKTLTDLISEGLSFYIKFKSEFKRFEKNKDTITSLFGAWGKGISGSSAVGELRSGKNEKKRENFLASLWKKS